MEVCNKGTESEHVQTGPKKKTSKLPITYTESNFVIHSFHIEINDTVVSIHVIKMLDSLFMWIGKGIEPNFADLSVAMISPYQAIPLSTKVLGSSLDTASTNCSSRLSKKLKKLVYVSYNIPLDRLTTTIVEKRIMEEIKQYPNRF